MSKDRDRRADFDDRVRHGRGRKDRRRWCRGKVGVEHKPVIVVTKDTRYASRGCGIPAWTSKMSAWFRAWERWCVHQEECASCGKVLRHQVDRTECPVWMSQRGA